ncbi:MAG: ice-binding family protein [Burkholderiaceae bacterium]
MNTPKFPAGPRVWVRWLLAVTLASALAACGGSGGGGRDPILGFDSTPVAAAPPTVTAVAPANRSTGVALNTTLLTAEFSEPVAPIAGSSSFVLSCAAPCVAPAGNVTLNAANRLATLTLTPGSTLTALTSYTATIAGARSLATNLSMVSPFVWTFSTGAVADVTRPRVDFTVPATSVPGPSTGVPVNSAISVVFTEAMAPASISSSSFLVTCAAPCTSPPGTVTYVVGNRSAVFSHGTLLASQTYTATITLQATDLAGNALAGNQAPLPAPSNYVWTFVTAAASAAAPVGNVSVRSTSPAANANNVCTDASVNATFDVPSGLRMDPARINADIFSVTGPAPGRVPLVAASVVYDAATGRIATFTPLAPLMAGVTYQARLRGGATGVRDLALPGNIMASDFTWTFTAVNCAAAGIPLAPALGSASTFGVFGGSAGITSRGLNTVINGDIGTTAASTLVTGFHDAGPGCTYTETPLDMGTVNGLIFTAAPPPTVGCPSEGTLVTAEVARLARADALAAYNALVARAGGPDPGAGNLANLVLAPGVYTSAAGTFRIQGGNLTLDAQGNANATWVFQMASSLTVGGPGAAFPSSVTLVNGAQARNVFWQVGSAATLNAGGGGTFQGTIISQDGAEISTAGAAALTIINGRVLSLGASVTMVNTVITVPAP